MTQFRDEIETFSVPGFLDHQSSRECNALLVSKCFYCAECLGVVQRNVIQMKPLYKNRGSSFKIIGL